MPDDDAQAEGDCFAGSAHSRAQVEALSTAPMTGTERKQDWIIKDIRIGSSVQPADAAPKDQPTAYHSPRLKRTIMGGPGNRSSIIDCSCGARFDGVYEYIGHDRRVCDWYARHAGIAGGGDAVARILRQYDEALDVVNYPDYSRINGWITVSPKETLDLLRTERTKEP